MTSSLLTFDCTLWRNTGRTASRGQDTYAAPVTIKAYYSDKVFRVGSRLTSSEEVYKHDINRDVSIVYTHSEIGVKDMILLGEISNSPTPTRKAKRLNDVRNPQTIIGIGNVYRGMF